MDFQDRNLKLFDYCQNYYKTYLFDHEIQSCVQSALKKSIKTESRPTPALVCSLLAEDLGAAESAWLMPLTAACAYFYTAADLLDDIQDHDHEHPLFRDISPEQALNITNFLLMGAYRLIGELQVPDGRKLALVKLFTQMGTLMSLGQFGDMAETNRLYEQRTPEEIARAKAGAEFACFFACVPIALGLDELPFYKLGEETGLLLQLLTDYFDIWILPHQQALSQDLLVFKNSFPVYWARQDDDWKELLELALAGKNNLPEQQFFLRRLLAQTQAVSSLARFLPQLKNQISQLTACLPQLPLITDFIESHYEQACSLLDALEELQARTEQKNWLSPVDLPQAMTMACDYLQFIPEYKDVWEVQRWGFLDEAPLYGNIFNRALVIEALLDSGLPCNESIMSLLKLSGNKGWHYYSNTNKIPVDTDDLGQMLQLASYIDRKSAAPYFVAPLELLQQNLERDGKCPTWLCDEQNFKRATIEQQWYGNSCFAVMANLYYGWACYDLLNYRAEIERGVNYLAQQFNPTQPGWLAVYYDSPFYTSYLMARLFQKLSFEFDFSTLWEQIWTTQCLDGSWKQSPQETAFVLLFLASSGLNTDKKLKHAIKRAQRFLIDAQLFDGSWAGEPLFIRPGKAAVYESFAHPKLSTAFCLRALNQSQRRLID